MAEQEKYKIMITDDDDFLVNMYATKFNLSGIEVEACNSGNMLLDKLRAGAKPDLILLDIVMAGLSGVETLGKIREEKLAESIPVVMLTNQNEEKDIEAAKKLGVFVYMVKSAVTPLEVVNEVTKIIKNSRG
jgi:two-component system, chemotaxis family, chemotaxis protein CheY